MTLDDLLIRRAGETDLTAIEQLAGCGIWPFVAPDNQNGQEFLKWMRVAAVGTDSRKAAWVAEAYGQTVAAIGAEATAPDLAVVSWARVKPKWRHPSLVFRLLEAALQFCRNRGPSRVCLEGQLFALIGLASREAVPLLDPRHDPVVEWLGLRQD